MNHSPQFLALVNDAKKRIKEMDSDQVLERLSDGEDLLLIDVREDNEWEAGHARGAVHMGRGVLERDIEGRVPELDRTLVLYCGGGFRSALAAESLQKMGYKNVFSLAGGWKAWRDAGGPVT